ncbi:MAG: NAD-dependent epimerase/dehydratase family protein [Deltaproteobacteria bacterium]|nr:NAD-dependent epimerase/dehydratase family protein [Deltaproteobacteria bacterium]MBT6488624.1 NAD-dependent epimerase/dehydratase family protein [Deltaproteobacteria bacterium]
MSESYSKAITGSTGHIGEALVRRLLEEPGEVRALIRKSPGSLPDKAVKTQGDLRDPESLRKAFKGCQEVYNLAAIISLSGDPDGQVWKTNVEGARNVAQAAADVGVQRLIHCSSIQAFVSPGAEGHLTEKAQRSLDSSCPVYDRSKAAAEEAVREVADQSDLEVVIINPSSVIGPFDFRPSRAGQLLLDLYHRKIPMLPPGGVDWVDVRDVAEGARLAARRGKPGQNYLLGGNWHRILELAKIATQSVNRFSPLPCPTWLVRGAIPFVSGWSKLCGTTPVLNHEALNVLEQSPRIDTTRARTELGYAPRPLSETIEDSYRFFADHGIIERPEKKG